MSMNKKIEELVPLMEESLNNGQLFSFPVRGTSMKPVLKTDDIVTVKKPDKLKKRDAIFYCREEKTYVLHRIIKIKDGILKVTGDNQTFIEDVKPENVIGVVVSYKRGKKVRKVTDFTYRCFVFFWSQLWLRKIIFKMFGR